MNFYLILSSLLLSHFLAIHGQSTDLTLAVSLTLSIILCVAVCLCSLCVVTGCIWDKVYVKKTTVVNSSSAVQYRNVFLKILNFIFLLKCCSQFSNLFSITSNIITTTIYSTNIYKFVIALQSTIHDLIIHFFIGFSVSCLYPNNRERSIGIYTFSHNRSLVFKLSLCYLWFRSVYIYS